MILRYSLKCIQSNNFINASRYGDELLLQQHIHSVNLSRRGTRALQARVAACPPEHLVQHDVGDAARKGVLLAWVITAHDEHGRPSLPAGTAVTGAPAGAPVAAPHQYLDAVPKRRPGPGHREPDGGEPRPDCLPGEIAEADDGAQAAGHEPELRRPPGPARIAFGSRRLVLPPR